MILWLFLVFSLLFLSQGAGAQVNVTLAPAAITVEQTLQPGRSYRLTPVTISNNGSKDIGIEMTYAATTPGGSLRIRPQEFFLAPGSRMQAFLYLSLPRVLPPGRYTVHIIAQPQTEGDIGLQLAAPIDFTVGEEAVLPFAGIFNRSMLAAFLLFFLFFVWHRKSLGAAK